MRKITGKTSLLALLGQPVSHSLSPIMHNAALEKMRLDWCYIAIPSETKDLEIITNALKKMNCKGVNITIPYKKTIFKLCDEVSEMAQAIQAVNTLIPNSNNGWTGTNTDIEGFLHPLLAKDLKNKQALVLGSGGSARAVVMGLKKLQISKITILSRSMNSLNNLLKDTKKSINPNTKQKSLIVGNVYNEIQAIKDIKTADLIINTTPIGMQTGKTANQEMPFGTFVWQSLTKNTILYDLIYTPRPTCWLKLGIEKGCTVIDGLEMLVQQGAASLKLWSGYKEIPIDIMRSAAENHLKN